MKKLYILILFLFFLTSSTDIIKANQIIFNDDFSNSLDKWTIVQNEGNDLWERCSNNGNSAHWIINDGWINITLDGPDCTTVIMPNNFNLDGISTYQIEFDWYLSESIIMDRNALLSWQDKDNWYGIRIYKENIYFEKMINGAITHFDNSRTSYPFKANTKYHFTLSYLADQRITLQIDGQLVLDMIDQAPYLNKKNIALKASLNLEQRSVSLFDNVVVTSLDEGINSDINSTILNVPTLKQNDPLWAEQEYDSANSWSTKPTIKRWGCALSSVAMILNYYKINTLPSGETITPETLNNWLKGQPDGYIGEGLLNWLAISRLTKQISDILQTPKLEYSRIGGNILEPTIDQIQKNQPTILNIFGHFLVSNGFTNDLLDLNILDPIYNYNLFSEHKTELLSTRIFTPSFTDLSYIMVVTDIDTEVEILDVNNQIPSEIEQFIESLGGDEINSDEVEIKQYKITQIAKPKTDNYSIIFSNTDNLNIPLSFSIYSYDQQGTATVIKKDNLIPNNKETYQLNYQKETTIDNQTTLNKIVTWESLITSIKKTKDNKLIADIYYNYIIKIINWAKIETVENQKRYITLLNNYLNKVDIGEEIKIELLNNINSMEF